MANLFLEYNMGNSGGSWFADALNTYPGVHVLEEPRRKLGYHPAPEGMTDRDLQKILLDYLREQEAGGEWQVVGYVKGFRGEILKYCEEKGGRVMQQFRNPIKVLHGTRKRVAQPTRWWGRPPADEHEYFEGHVRWMARRYARYLDRAGKYPLVRLEDLSASLVTPDAEYFRRTMEYATQLDWDSAAVQRVRKQARPRHRTTCQGDDCWREDYVEPKYASRSWPDLVDPAPRAIWEHWANWQRSLFLECFEKIMISAGYDLPPVGG